MSFNILIYCFIFFFSDIILYVFHHVIVNFYLHLLCHLKAECVFIRALMKIALNQLFHSLGNIILNILILLDVLWNIKNLSCKYCEKNIGLVLREDQLHHENSLMKIFCFKLRLDIIAICLFRRKRKDVQCHDLFYWTFINEMSMVSCPKGPTCHAYAWQIGPFWQDTLDA